MSQHNIYMLKTLDREVQIDTKALFSCRDSRIRIALYLPFQSEFITHFVRLQCECWGNRSCFLWDTAPPVDGRAPSGIGVARASMDRAISNRR